MAIKERHVLRRVSASIDSGSNSGAKTMDEATSALLHIDGASGSVVTVQASKDGTLWWPLFDESGSAVAFTMGAGGNETHVIKYMPRNFRLAVTVANVGEVWIEGLREIA